MKKKIKELIKERNFAFYVNEDGKITLDKYGVNRINPEVFVQQRPNDHKLTSVMIEGMSDTNPYLNSTLEFLISIDDKFKVARLRLDNNPQITVEDFLKQNIIKNDLPEYLYHGTSLKSANEILKSGLLPRNLSMENSKYKSIQSGESLSDRSYLCTYGNIGSAKFAARFAASHDGSRPVILKIKADSLLKDNIYPDEDAKMLTWKESINSIGSIAYKGIIESKNIEIELDMTQDLNNGKSIVDYIKGKTDNSEKNIQKLKK